MQSCAFFANLQQTDFIIRSVHFLSRVIETDTGQGEMDSKERDPNLSNIHAQPILSNISIFGEIKASE